MTYKTPGGRIYDLYADMLKQPHLLIAGATGSGKSVIINGLICTDLRENLPGEGELILIDPKRVELSPYGNIPHCVRYASEPADMVDALRGALGLIESRYRAMASQGIRKYAGGDCYVIIDELADLMTTNRREVQPLLQRIAQIGRAARVHIIAATQCPISRVIPTEIKVNFDSRVGLRTRSAQDSRNILGCRGCETLPRYGQAYYMTPEGLELYSVPMIPEEEQRALIRFWDAYGPAKPRKKPPCLVRLLRAL